MVLKYCKKTGVSVINIVRKEEQVDILKDIDAQYILNSESDTFISDLKELSTELQATGFFDPVGGEQTMKVLRELPYGSTVYLVDNLSGEATSFNSLELIHSEKSFSYINVTPWILKKTPEDIQNIMGEIALDLAQGGEIFGITVYKTYPLSEFEKAFEDSIKYASIGKVLLKPQE
mmetsp:Transcript_15201/g.16917  ORF Transcript_15201/g.16917 Transcript_15201/m.16917 type:complete len:176 (-) Transcript_15201:47-574(-)